jgi:hypothetical protein
MKNCENRKGYVMGTQTIKFFLLLAITLIFLSCSVSRTGINEKETTTAQESGKLDSAATESHRGIWIRFWDDEERLIGYKDESGAVKIEPKFFRTSSCDEFDNIIAVTEKINGEWKGYYLTKTGKIVGKDSLYYLENELDCETEGFIRFKDRKNDREGLFDRNGNVVVPAEYNYIDRVINGVITALKGAERKSLDPREEHNYWVGGKHMLIDTLNNVLIEDFDENFNDNPNEFLFLDFFSIEKTKTPHPDTTRKSFPAKGGGYYSFINFGKEFEQWLAGDLLLDLTVEKLINASRDSIDFCMTDNIENCVKVDRLEFITDNFETLKKELRGTPYVAIFTPGWLYYGYSGNSKERFIPEMGVRGFRENSADDADNNNYYIFLKVDKGYKLIRAHWKR